MESSVEQTGGCDSDTEFFSINSQVPASQGDQQWEDVLLDRQQDDWRPSVSHRQVMGSFRDNDGRGVSRASGWYDVTEDEQDDDVLPEGHDSHQQPPLASTETTLGAPREFRVNQLKEGKIYLRWEPPSPGQNDDAIEEYHLTVKHYIEHCDSEDDQYHYDSSAQSAVIPIANNVSYVFFLTARTASSVSEPAMIQFVLRKHKLLKRSRRLEKTCTDKPVHLVPLKDTTTVGGVVIRMELDDSLPCISNTSQSVVDTGTGTFEVVQARSHFPDNNTQAVILVLGNDSEKLIWKNSLLNHILGVEYEDRFRFTFNQHSFQSQKSQRHSVIHTVNYQEGLRNKRITVCELQDTTTLPVWKRAGTLKTLLRKTCDSGCGGVDYVNAIALVLSSDDPPPKDHIAKSLRAVFGPDVVENMLLIFTDNDEYKQRQLLSDRRWRNLSPDIQNMKRYSLNTQLILEKQLFGGDMFWCPTMEKYSELLATVASMSRMVVTQKC